jgi:hypothetical protein
MKRFFLFALWLAAFAFAEDMTSAPWAKGEKLSYRLSWGFITAGSADMLTLPLGDGKIEFVSVARNNGAFNSIYPVADTIRTISVGERFLPESFKKILNEGSYHSTSKIFFDRGGKKAVLSDTVFENSKRKEIKRRVDTTVTIQGYEHCIISAFYRVRSMDLTGKKDTYFSAVSGKKRYSLQVVIHGKETVETDLGKFDCIKVEPMLGDDGAFKASGRLFIWLTDDARRLPVLMTVKIPIGSIRGELVQFRQGTVN